ncbi:MAG TPA: porin [Burkholderiales bacterium]|nr:porin [Burkholderiales bacterium]
MKHRKTQLAAAVGAAMALGAGAVQAQQATTVQSGQNLQIQLYGQVNRALMFADDGVQSKTFFVDGEPSGTRFGIMGSAQVAPGLRAGARFEVEYQSNSSDSVSMTVPSVNPGFAERWFDVFVEGGWGRINLGQGSGAADDASTIDLSGTALANGVCVCDWGGALSWRTAAGGTIGGRTLGNTHNNFDFESRYDRVMYTTPVFGGFRAQVGTGQKTAASEVNEASIWWSGKLAGEIQAALGWSEEKLNTVINGDHNETIGGSVSWLHTSGLNVTFAYTESKTPNVAPSVTGTHMWTKVGYKWGQHAIAVSYGLMDDQFADGDEGDAIGIGYVWTPIRWAEFYVGLHQYTLDARVGGATVSAEDIQVAAIGTRIRF